MKTVPAGTCAQNPPCLYHSGWADGAAAERDRIRQLAEDVRAQFWEHCDDMQGTYYPFADLLRGDPS